MTPSSDKEKMLSEMTRAEKAELLRWIVRDLGDDSPGIESKPASRLSNPHGARSRQRMEFCSISPTRDKGAD